MTVVPSDNALPTLVARVVGSERDEHDECTALRLEPIKSPEWLRWLPPAGEGAAWHQRVMVLAGSALKAHALPNDKVERGELPRGTDAKDLLLAVDADGDDQLDVVARIACKDGRHDCEEDACEEVWVRGQGKWRMTDQICGD